MNGSSAAVCKNVKKYKKPMIFSRSFFLFFFFYGRVTRNIETTNIIKIYCNTSVETLFISKINEGINNGKTL